MNWRAYISSDRNVLSGKPVVTGTRLSVDFLLSLLAQGWSEGEILDNYPQLSQESLRAIFGYARETSAATHVAYTVEQDETGWFCAHAALPGGGAHGEGRTHEEAIADLEDALIGWVEEFGAPNELTVGYTAA